MQAASIEAVIFDMDGVILDSERPATAAWKGVLRDLGYCLTDEINRQLIGRNVPDSDAILRETLGKDFPVDAARRAAKRRFAELTAVDGILLKPGVQTLLDFLDAKAIKRAIATSTAREACERALRRHDLLHRFDATVCGDEVDAGKPAPDIFLEAARRLHARPAACVVLEDSFAGIRAAHAAGMMPIMVPDSVPPDATIRRLAYRLAPTLSDARDVIASLLINGR